MAQTLPPSANVGADAARPGGSGGPGMAATGGDTGMDTGGTADSFPFPPFEVVEVKGTPGADVLLGDADNEHIQGFRGDDLLYGGVGDDTLDGGIGDDRLEGGPGFDSYDGGPGNDTLTFRIADGPALVDLAQSTVQHAGTFEFVQEVENVTGSVFGDTLLGDDHDNVLQGGGGLDLLAGGLGDDVLAGGADGAYASWADSQGGVQVDLARGKAREWDGGQDRLSDILGAVGSDHDDTLLGDDGANRLEGGGGDDVLRGRAGDDSLAGGDGGDILDGGAGRDLADYSGAEAVQVFLGAGMAVDGGGAIDTLSGFEDVLGSLGDDTLTGDGGDNRLTGSVGRDVLTGGGGADTFVYNDRLEFGDVIRDFGAGDRIEMDESLLETGSLSMQGDRLTWQEEGGDPVLVAIIQGGSPDLAADVLVG